MDEEEAEGKDREKNRETSKTTKPKGNHDNIGTESKPWPLRVRNMSSSLQRWKSKIGIRLCFVDHGMIFMIGDIARASF